MRKNNIILMVIIIALTTMAYFVGLKNASFYDDRFECDLILEQRVACYQGCKIVLTTLKDVNFSYENYKGCTRLCEEHYYLEFDLDGSMKHCEYDWINKTNEEEAGRKDYIDLVKENLGNDGYYIVSESVPCSYLKNCTIIMQKQEGLKHEIF